MFFFFFFFQAEDGIRDKLVTGVQTCALPILSFSRGTRAHVPLFRHSASRGACFVVHIPARCCRVTPLRGRSGRANGSPAPLPGAHCSSAGRSSSQRAPPAPAGAPPPPLSPAPLRAAGASPPSASPTA